ncbi:MAG: sigma-54-dependent Fis family transcriptional regulator [Deltaproteobacteria bacterium]|jgi:two-component system nitrogen regulation response regulator NtrX|nr:sigma-54-dependent Fis family transcriptional regulator [Deltaproteobacteria bacterium]
MHTILIVDDEQSIRDSLTGILQDEGFAPSSVSSGEQAIRYFDNERPDLVLLDIWMPGMDGLAALSKIRELYPEQLVIMMSGHGNIETAVRATKLGAYDFIEKPLSLEKVLLSIHNAMHVSQLVEENRELKAKIAKDYEMVGTSPSIMELKQQIEVAGPTSGWILITGENGTGKELVARAIHHSSLRASKPFVEVNCAAIPEELIESELFGHEKGAFTGATTQRRGKFDQAHEGTLFLDEISDMSLKTQAKVLRILQEHKFERVGGNKTIVVDVRVIAATNKDLEFEIQENRFREDLFYRLNVIPFHVPPLRERRDDIEALANHFLVHFCSKESRDIKALDEQALAAIKRYHWPGNVRELKNLIERMVIMTPGKIISKDNLPPSILHKQPEVFPELEIDNGSSAGSDSFKQAKEDFEKIYLLNKLKEYDWNVSKTAEAIGIERSNLHRKIKTYQIKLEKQ